MKTSVVLLSVGCMALFSLLSCRKEDKGTNGTGSGTLAGADAIFDHLRLFNAVKKQGSIPAGPGSGPLKISFEDTLYLVDEVPQIIKFLTSDTNRKVAGIYLQVYTGLAGGPLNTTQYADLPETPGIPHSDSVSIIPIGFDPSGSTPPLTFNIRIVPYDKDKRPLGQADRPVKLVPHTNDPSGKGSGCGLELLPGEMWDWDYSFRLSIPYSPGHPFDFWDDPNTSFNTEGQTIRGSCCSGYSVYGICPGTREPNASLHFATYYRIAREWLIFNGGSFVRYTTEENPAPLPDSSDFCAGGEGKVRSHTSYTTYRGSYSILPVHSPSPYQNDTVQLVLNTTSQDPAIGGFGNGGGAIHQLDCQTLMLAQVDPQGLMTNFYRVYSHRTPGDILWFELTH